jgi:hypothetical protein
MSIIACQFLDVWRQQSNLLLHGTGHYPACRLTDDIMRGTGEQMGQVS